LNVARIFAYTRFLEEELEIARQNIDKLMAKIPDVREQRVSGVSKPVEFKPLLRRPSARDFIRSEEQRIVKEMNEPKSNVKVVEAT
jgi:hypothetical protein